MCNNHDHSNDHSAEPSQASLTDIWAGLDGDLEEGQEETQETTRGKFETALDARRYIGAGKATITLVSTKTGVRFTYRVNVPEDRATGQRATDGTLMVSVMTGPDNSTSFTWLGRVAREIFWVGRKVPKPGEIGKDAPCSKAFDFAWRALLRNVIPEGLEIWHESYCGRCGRKLTVPSSVSRGFGPECADRMGL